MAKKKQSSYCLFIQSIFFKLVEKEEQQNRLSLIRQNLIITVERKRNIHLQKRREKPWIPLCLYVFTHSDNYLHQTDEISLVASSIFVIGDWEINGSWIISLEFCSISITEELFNWFIDGDGVGCAVGVYCCCWNLCPNFEKFFRRFLIFLYRQQSKQGVVKIKNGRAIKNKKIRPKNMPTIVKRWRKSEPLEWPKLKWNNVRLDFYRKKLFVYRFRQGPLSKWNKKKSFWTKCSKTIWQNHDDIHQLTSSDCKQYQQKICLQLTHMICAQPAIHSNGKRHRGQRFMLQSGSISYGVLKRKLFVDSFSNRSIHSQQIGTMNVWMPGRTTFQTESCVTLNWVDQEKWINHEKIHCRTIVQVIGCSWWANLWSGIKRTSPQSTCGQKSRWGSFVTSEQTTREKSQMDVVEWVKYHGPLTISRRVEIEICWEKNVTKEKKNEMKIKLKKKLIWIYILRRNKTIAIGVRTSGGYRSWIREKK